jgi:hypothetical protein
MAAMITVEQAGLDIGKADLTSRILGRRVLYGWRDEGAGAVWVIEAPADSTGVREELKNLWAGGAAKVQWWSALPVPNTIVPTES